MPKLETVRFVAEAIILQKKKMAGNVLAIFFFYISAVSHAQLAFLHWLSQLPLHCLLHLFLRSQ